MASSCFSEGLCPKDEALLIQKVRKTFAKAIQFSQVPIPKYCCECSVCAGGDLLDRYCISTHDVYSLSEDGCINNDGL